MCGRLVREVWGFPKLRAWHIALGWHGSQRSGDGVVVSRVCQYKEEVPMRRIKVAWVIGAVGLWLAMALPGLSAEAFKVVVMDQQVVMEQSKMGKRALEELKAYSSTRQKIINADDLELKELEQRIQDGKLTDSVRQEKQGQFQAKMETYQRRLADFNREIQQRQREMVAEYAKKVQAAAQVVAEKNGYTAILDKGSETMIKIVLYYEPALDVTDQLVKEFDRQNK